MSESLRGGPLYTDNKNIPGAAAIKLTKVKFLSIKPFGIHQNIINTRNYVKPSINSRKQHICTVQ